MNPIRLLPSGNPFEYHVPGTVETLSFLRPVKQYIITTMLDVVLYCFCFVFAFCLCPCMAINVVSIQYNGGLLPGIILLTQQCHYHRGTHVEVLYSVLRDAF